MYYKSKAYMSNKISWEKETSPRTVVYRADVQDIANYILTLMKDETLREKMGKVGRERVVANFDYRVVVKKIVQIMNEKMRYTSLIRFVYN